MDSFGRVVVGSAAIASVVIGSAVGCLLGAAAFFATDGLTPKDTYRSPTSAAFTLGGVIPLVQLSRSERATGDEARITKNQMHNAR